MITGNFLDPLFNFMTKGSPTWVLFWFSLILAFLSIIAYKYTTDQKALKKLQEKTKQIQARMRALQRDLTNKDSKKEMSRLNKEMMAISGEQMKHSLKSTFITLIPFLLVFAWLGAHYSYQPLYPNQPFNITLTSVNNISSVRIDFPGQNITLLNRSSTVVADTKGELLYIKRFTLKAPPGDYSLFFKNGNVTLLKKNIIVTDSSNYAKPVEVFKGKNIRLGISNKPLRIKFLGMSMSWFWYYFIIMMIFTSLFRKLLKVY